MELPKVNEAINLVCRQPLGVLDSSFLCQSLGVLTPKAPISVYEDSPVRDAVAMLREESVGCLLVITRAGALCGIFSERDCLRKVMLAGDAVLREPVSAVMTRDPVTQPIDATIGFALTLMSEGGFRHLPIVDESGAPTGIISVKDVMDYIVRKFLDDVLSFSAGET